MKKFIIIIFVLSVFIVLSYRYLKNSVDEKKTYILSITSKPLIYRKKKLEIEDIDSFEFDEFFSILSNNEYQFKYSFTDENILISLNNERFSYPYTIKEKEKEIITEYIIREVYVNSISEGNNDSQIQEASYHSSEGINNSFEYEAEYFNLLNSSLSFEKGTDISVIINSIQSNIDTNKRISIDYSLLNPNDEGEYPVYIYSDDDNKQIIIKII